MPKLHRLFLLPALVAALLSAGCAGLRTAAVPMPTDLHTANCASAATTLVVMLPGASSTTDEFVREGFVQQLRERRIAADVLLADAHMGYYNGRSIVARLEADVLEPARARGYNAIWLLGISVGGFGALLHEEAIPGRIAGLVLLAPYLGQRPLTDEISRAGGLGAWKAPAGNLPAEDTDAMLWRWLQEYGATASSAGRPPLYLGYGISDRFAPSHRLLAAALPAGQVFTTPGGHDWGPWRALWEQMLAALPLPRCG